MDFIHVGRVLKGKVALNDQDRFDNFLKSLEGQIVQVIVRKPKKTRSLNQNNFLWGVCYRLISEATGFSNDEVHDAMRMLFLRDESKKIPTLRSTTSLSTVEMNDYWAKMQQFAAEKLGVIIPDPNQIDLSDEDYHG